MEQEDTSFSPLETYTTSSIPSQQHPKHGKKRGARLLDNPNKFLFSPSYWTSNNSNTTTFSTSLPPSLCQIPTSTPSSPVHTSVIHKRFHSDTMILPPKEDHNNISIDNPLLSPLDTSSAPPIKFFTPPPSSSKRYTSVSSPIQQTNPHQDVFPSIIITSDESLPIPQQNIKNNETNLFVKELETYERITYTQYEQFMIHCAQCLDCYPYTNLKFSLQYYHTNLLSTSSTTMSKRKMESMRQLPKQSITKSCIQKETKKHLLIQHMMDLLQFLKTNPHTYNTTTTPQLIFDFFEKMKILTLSIFEQEYPHLLEQYFQNQSELLLYCLDKWFYSSIYSCLFFTKNSHIIDVDLYNRIKSFNFISTSHLKIPAQIVETKQWQLAVQILKRMNQFESPNTKLQVLIHSVKLVFESISSVICNQEDQNADLLQPCIIYLTLKSNPKHLHSTIQYIRNFSSELHGQEDYIFCTVESAVYFLERANENAFQIDSKEYKQCLLRSRENHISLSHHIIWTFYQ